jgi:hypothetical protein
VAVPEADGVKVALQLAVPVVEPATRVQGEPVKAPAAPVEPKVTMPAGVIGEPILELSETVAVQLEG